MTMNTDHQDDDQGQDVITQIRVAGANPLPLVIGALLGALVPVGTFTVGHYEISTWLDVRSLIFLGGLMFSAITVFRWGQRAYGSTPKAFFFVLLAEGLMSFSTTAWISVTALMYLVCINAVANGCNLATQHAARRARDAARAQAAATQDAAAIVAPAAPAVDALVAALASVEARLASMETRAQATAPATLAAPTTETARAAKPAKSPRAARPRRATEAKAPSSVLN